MTHYFVKPDEQFPDSAHDWWLRKDQFTVGKLWVGETDAQQIARQLNTYADLLAALEDEVRAMYYNGSEPAEATLVALAKAKGE